MKNKTKVIIAVICTIILFTYVFLMLFQSNIISPHNHSTDYFLTEPVALEIGKIVCKNAYPQIDYTSLVWECFEKDDIWIVFCINPSNNMLGGGLPKVHLENNGRIIFVGLTK